MEKNRLFVVMLALLFGGCATTGRKLQFATANLQDATIYVYDDVGGVGFTGRDLVTVDGVPVVKLNRRQYTWFYVPPGAVQISMSDPRDPDRVRATMPLCVQAGKPYHLHYRIPPKRQVEEVVVDGFSKEPAEVVHVEPEDFVAVRESDGIAMTETYCLVVKTVP